MQARDHPSRRYQQQLARRALNPTGGFLSGFTHSLNPYLGCAFGGSGGCPFCYVRMLPVARLDSGGWGSWVIAKTNLPELLETELDGLRRRGKLAELAIFMSSATDPYQGAELRFKLTRRALEVLDHYEFRRLLVQTRSPLIERDIPLLQSLGARVIASITIETDDDDARRAITPTSPSIERRLTTAAKLKKAGIFTQIAVAPMLPNHPAHFAELLQANADRVIVDTYLDGDGAGGRRSRQLGIPELYQRLGYQGWFEQGAEDQLVSALRKRLGISRVLFSRQGFNSL